jgi:hypothetical protein
MATLREYFDTGFPHALAISQPQRLQSATDEVEVIARMHYEFDSNAKFISFFVPSCKSPLDVCLALVDHPEWALNLGGGVIVEAGFGGMIQGSGFSGGEKVSSSQLHFTGKVFIYCEAELSPEGVTAVQDRGRANRLIVILRGPRYAHERAMIEQPLAFISHDSRDKSDVARPLALELQKLRCPVWYDEFSLQVGQSLRESIEAGLKTCKRCILVLSQNFLSNTGWTKVEFNSIFTREIMERRHLVLPVWHGVTSHEVYSYSPSLADRVGVNWSLGTEEVCRRLYKALTTE